MFVRYFCFFCSVLFFSISFFLRCPRFWLTSCVLLLAACGGGGGGGPSPSAVSETDAGVVSDTPLALTLKNIPDGWETDADIWAASSEFQAQRGLLDIGVAYGYAAGVTGDGQVIGFIDTGLDDTHAAFNDGRVVFNDRSGLSLADDVQLDHGTSVAGVAAASRDDVAMHGVAFNADIAMWSLHMNAEGNLTISNAILRDAVTGLQDSGAKIINQSWGYKTLLAPSLITTQAAFLAGQYPDMLAEMRWGMAVHVWAAGNEAGAQVAVTSAIPILFPELAGLSVAVAALDENGVIAPASNRCGAMAQNCLAAPGGASVPSAADTIVPAAGGGYGYARGTSYAAPYVSGVLALMMEAFGDQLSVPEYTARLLATADNTGVYGNAAVYGRGVVDVRAALSPAGALNIPMPDGGLTAPSSSFVGGGLLPEDMLEQLQNEKIIVLDTLGTPFEVPMSAFVSPATEPDTLGLVPTPKLVARSDDAQYWIGVPFAQAAHLAPAAAPYLQTYRGASGRMNVNHASIPAMPNVVITRFAGRDGYREDGPQVLGISAKYLPMAKNSNDSGMVSFHGGVVLETAGLLGSIGQGALQTGTGHTTFVGLSGNRRVSATMQIGYRADIGFSALEGRSASLVRGANDIISSRFAVDLDWRGWNFEVAQPLHFEQGDIDFRLPAQRLPGGDVIFRDQSLAISQTRSMDMHIEKDYDVGPMTLRLQGDAVLAGSRRDETRFGIGLHWPLNGS